MCQRSASTARPSSIAPRITPEQELGPLGPGHPGLLEQRDAVGDRLHPGQRAAPGRERLEHQQHAHRLQRVRGSSERPGWGGCSASGWIRPMAMMASSPTMNTHGREQERPCGSPRPRRLSTVITARMPRQIGTVCRGRGREGRGQRAHPGGDGDGDGQRVVDDEGGAGDQADLRARSWPATRRRRRRLGGRRR